MSVNILKQSTTIILMTSLRLTYTLLKQYFKIPHICNHVTCCSNDSYTPPHFLLVFFQNILISLFYVFCLENIFFIANNKRLYFTNKHTDETENNWKVFYCKNKTVFSLCTNKYISCSHPGSY